MKLTKEKWCIFEKARDNLIDSFRDSPEKITLTKFWVLELMSPQIRGPLMEKRHIALNKSVLSKVNASLDRGDFTNKNGLYCEYKFSILGINSKCNFVQIRPHQKVDYILEIYEVESGELLTYYVPHQDMSEMVMQYGGLAHGTKKTNTNHHKEYALRPSTKGKGKAFKAWKALQAYKVDQLMLRRIYDGEA